MKLTKYLQILVVVFGVVGMGSTGLALPIVNDPNDGFEDIAPGTVYGYYQNSGSLLFTKEGNNPDAGPAYKWLQDKMLNDYGVTLTKAEGSLIGFSQHDSNSGTWQTLAPLGPGGTISFYVVKAGNWYAMYRLDPAASSGSWSTYDCWSMGAGGPNGVQISHFTGYNPGTSSVPEPTTMLLLGIGLIGLAGVGSRRLVKN